MFKKKGKSNDRILGKFVCLASYATSSSNFFRFIEDGVLKLFDQNPALVSDAIRVGLYLLDFHPHLWTSIANSK